MMKYSIVISLIMLPALILGQERLVVENSLSKNEDSLICYVGIPNPLSIFVMGVNGDTLHGKDINVIFEGGDMPEVKTRKNKVTNTDVYYTKPGHVKLRILVNGERKYVDCHVRYIPNPYAGLNRQRDSVMTKEQLAAFVGLVIFFDDVDFRLRAVITSFTFNAEINGNSVSIRNNGPYFSKDIKEAIQQLKPGSIVSFEDIKMRLPDSRDRILMSYWVRIL